MGAALLLSACGGSSDAAKGSGATSTTAAAGAAETTVPAGLPDEFTGATATLTDHFDDSYDDDYDFIRANGDRFVVWPKHAPEEGDRTPEVLGAAGFDPGGFALARPEGETYDVDTGNGLLVRLVDFEGADTEDLDAADGKFLVAQELPSGEKAFDDVDVTEISPSTVRVAGDRIVLAASHPDDPGQVRLTVLDAADGSEVFTTDAPHWSDDRPEDEDGYTVTPSTLVLYTATDIRALSLEDGRELWAVDVPPGDVFHASSNYHVPVPVTFRPADGPGTWVFGETSGERLTAIESGEHFNSNVVDAGGDWSGYVYSDGDDAVLTDPEGVETARIEIGAQAPDTKSALVTDDRIYLVVGTNIVTADPATGKVIANTSVFAPDTLTELLGTVEGKLVAYDSDEGYSVLAGSR
jgi:hypothetical protein